MSALILALPDRHQWSEPTDTNLPSQGNVQMSRKLQTSGWIAFGVALAALAATAVASFSGGLHVEAGGVQMTVQADLERGVQLIFAATA